MRPTRKQKVAAGIPADFFPYSKPYAPYKPKELRNLNINANKDGMVYTTG